MKLLIFCLSLLAILLQAISGPSNHKQASLRSKMTGLPKPKKAIGGLVWKKKAPAKPSKKNGAGRHSKWRAAIKRPKSLSEILPKALVEMVLGYFIKGAYSILVSAHDWLLEECMPRIAVDSVRLYVMTDTEGMRGLNHSSSNASKGRRRYTVCGPQWFSHSWFSGSHDGRCIFFGHKYSVLAGYEERTKHGTKWLAQGSKLEGGRFKRVVFGGKRCSDGLLSRDGLTLYSYDRVAGATRAYRIEDEAEGALASMKFKLNGVPRAVNGECNRVMITTTSDQLEIYNISSDAGTLVCRVDVTNCYVHICALNKDGSEAAFVTQDRELRVMKVGKVFKAYIHIATTVGVSGSNYAELAKASIWAVFEVAPCRGAVSVLADKKHFSFFATCCLAGTLLHISESGQSSVFLHRILQAKEVGIT